MDLKECKQKIKTLEFEIEKYKYALEQAKLDFFNINLETGEATQSEHLSKKMGYDAEEVNTFEKRNATFHPDDLQKNLNLVNELVQGKIQRTDLLFRVYGKTNELYWLKHDGTVIVDPNTNERHFIGVLRDVTTEKGHVDHLEFMVNYDVLTGTYNRRSGLNKLREDIQRYDTLSVVYIDFDDFKAINDSYGHEAGDLILVSYAAHVMAKISDLDYLIRLGGDEFLLVVPSKNFDEAKTLVNHINQEKICYDTNRKMSFSYGIEAYDKKKHLTLESLINKADQMMYSYKENSKQNRLR